MSCEQPSPEPQGRLEASGLELIDFDKREAAIAFGSAPTIWRGGAMCCRSSSGWRTGIMRSELAPIRRGA